jgi:hypothetical protein
LIPYSPLHAGLLAGALEASAHGRISDASMQRRTEAHRDQLEAFEGLCRELGARPEAVAVAWLLHNPVVSTAIVDATTIEELQLAPTYIFVPWQAVKWWAAGHLVQFGQHGPRCAHPSMSRCSAAATQIALCEGHSCGALRQRRSFAGADCGKNS